MLLANEAGCSCFVPIWRLVLTERTKALAMDNFALPVRRINTVP